jgi:hypothetical protein
MNRLAVLALGAGNKGHQQTQHPSKNQTSLHTNSVPKSNPVRSDPQALRKLPAGASPGAPPIVISSATANPNNMAANLSD